MLRNYIKLTIRNLLKSKVYSLINILGLATGMMVSTLIGLWIWDELHFDTWHTHHERIAKVLLTQTFNGHTSTNHAIAMPLGPELKNKYHDDFNHIVLTSWNFGHLLSVGEKRMNNQGMWVEPDFPEMFSLDLLSGSLHALKDPSAMLLSQSVATTLFGQADPMGKTVRMDNRMDFTIAGVYTDLPSNTTLSDVKYLLPWSKYLASEQWLEEARSEWNNHSFQMYVELKPGNDVAAANQKIKHVSRPHVNTGSEVLVLHPMDKWHLFSEFKEGVNVGGRIEFVWLFGIVGVFVLLLACINFMNLSTARSEKRAREVGIRKAVGSVRSQLVTQFLCESLVVTFLAMLLSVGLVLMALPYFNTLASKSIVFPYNEPLFWLVAVVFTCITGLVSGSYPAFYLSGFQPVKVLKGTFRLGRLASLPRRVLVVVQFTVSVTLIIGTIIVFYQIRHAQNRPVGYTREGLVFFDMVTPEIIGRYNALRDDLLKTGVVADMCESLSPTTDIWSNQLGFDWVGKDPNLVPLLGVEAVTHDFGNTVGWKIKQGRDFSRSFPSDTGALILNESAVKLAGFKNPVGQMIHWQNKDRKVLGVVEDMVMQSPYEPVTATVFFLEYNWSNVITVRVKPELPMKEALARIEPVFKQYNPSGLFDYKFIDETYARKFDDERRIGNLASLFAGLAIFISCLGLFGLAAFVAEQRTKEIGVRKVLGATIFNLWAMLSKDFVQLVLISCTLAGPIAWFFLADWLENFDYRIEIRWWIFVAAAAGAVVVTLATVSFQAIKAALANPAKSLRTE